MKTQDSADKAANGGCVAHLVRCSSSDRDAKGAATLSVAYKAVAVTDAIISGMHLTTSIENCLIELIGALVLTGRIPEHRYLPSESERPSEMKKVLADLQERFLLCHPCTIIPFRASQENSTTSESQKPQGH